MAWRSRRSRRCRCPCSGPAPSPDADGLLYSPRAAVEDVVLGVSSASRCVRAFPRLDAAATCLLAFPHDVAFGDGRKTPMGLVVGALGLRPCPAFESRGRGRQGESPNLPRARPAGRRRRRWLSSRQTGCRGATRRGAKARFLPRAWLGPCACTHRSLDVRARWSRRASHPARARLRRGSPGAPHPRRGEDKVGEEGEARWLTRGPCPSAIEARKR
jgi:hypothetical protein